MYPVGAGQYPHGDPRLRPSPMYSAAGVNRGATLSNDGAANFAADPYDNSVAWSDTDSVQKRPKGRAGPNVSAQLNGGAAHVASQDSLLQQKRKYTTLETSKETAEKERDEAAEAIQKAWTHQRFRSVYL